jgi:hypothetical protein
MPFYHLKLIDGPRADSGADKAECFVTAADEDAARAAASQCLSKPHNGRSPWSDSSAVRCRPVRGLNRMPPPEGVVIVPDRFAFIGWRAIEIPASDGNDTRWPANRNAWPVCD